MSQLSSSRKIYAFGSFILGILLLFWPGSALRMAAYAAGIIIMAGGLTSILAHFRRKTRTAGAGANLLIGIIVTLVGGWVFLNPEDFASIIPSALGYLIVISGIVKLLETFSLSKAHYRNWWISLLAGVATIIMGLFLVNHAFGIVSTMVRLGGVFLIFNGVSDLWINRRVDEYVHYSGRDSADGRHSRSGMSSDRSARYNTSDPDIIDAEDFREM